MSGEPAAGGSRRLMAFFAHPDDEAFGVGGTLAALAREGVAVTLVCATRGEVGQMSRQVGTDRSRLPEIREAELREAGRILGAKEVRILGFRDGQLERHEEEALERLVAEVRRWRPQVLVTFGPDGIYGHSDHKTVHRLAVAAFDDAADPRRYPHQFGAGLEPHAVQKLYYHVLSRERLERMRARGIEAVDMDGVLHPLVGYDEEEITLARDISALSRVKMAAIRAHRSQLVEEGRWEELDEEQLEGFLNPEFFILARSRVGQAGKESDFFERVS